LYCILKQLAERTERLVPQQVGAAGGAGCAPSCVPLTFMIAMPAGILVAITFPATLIGKLKVFEA